MVSAGVENVADAAKGAGAGVAGTVAADAAGGLDMAAKVAGDVLRGIFGGLPWEMSPGEIARAVTPDFIEPAAGGGGEAAAMLVPHLMDVVGVVA